MLPVAFVDDDVSKHGHRIHDIPVLGPISSIASVLEIHAISEVVVAMPSVTGDVVRGVVRAALDAGITARTVPALQDILTGNVSVTQFREIQIEDLLRRTPIQTDLEAVGALVSNRVVMVTGAGGSIGSELCRQVARLSPSRLVLLGHGENSIFEITEELGHSQPDAPIEAVIADVRDRDRIQQVFDRIRPDVVFHAAAHKHVPLMEANVIEAITNNIVGTLNVVRSAASVGTQNFVLISSDKAVQPTSVMGATKRVAEQVVQLEAERSGLAFVAVRFGNVLGSRGSVVPTFLRQIRAGGPVKVTHPEMTRYFMTIPEAVQLVLQAGALGMGGEVFVLDMGEPVRIVDLARDLIRLSGLREDVDVKIQFTGPRPGEKLFEEVFLSEEEVSHTQHPKVLRVRHAEVRPGTEERVAQIARVAQQHGSDTQIRALLTELVPAYAPPSWERRTTETASTNGSNGAKPTLSVEFTPHLIDAACEDNAVPAPAGDRRAS
jgi:FlaA1/EpsC-like NDP-sugar epimerase